MNESIVAKNGYRVDEITEERECFTDIRRFKISLMRLVGYLISYTLFLVNKFRWIKPANPGKIIWVDPNKIVRSIEFSKIVRQRRYYMNGMIKGGDWDKGTYTVFHVHNELFKAFERRYLEGSPYLETDYFKQKDLPKPELKALADKYKRRYDYIFSEVMKDGFSIPSSVFDHLETFKVSISSKGEFLFMTGKHRLAIAKLMRGDNKIPVKVSHRHEKWQKYRDKLYTELAAGKIQEEDILDMNHPDLLDLLKTGNPNPQNYMGK